MASTARVAAPVDGDGRGWLVSPGVHACSWSLHSTETAENFVLLLLALLLRFGAARQRAQLLKGAVSGAFLLRLNFTELAVPQLRSSVPGSPRRAARGRNATICRFKKSILIGFGV
jgi:hypothetical protein